MPKLNHKIYRVWMFVVGILATLAYRLIVVLNHYSALWVQIAWYIGTIGFVWYFAHRFNVEKRRDQVIEDLSLIKKVQESEVFGPEEKSALVYILKSLQTSLAKWNYIAIFVISSLALAYGIYQDFVSLLIKY
jgi:hypothetical protein